MNLWLSLLLVALGFGVVIYALAFYLRRVFELTLTDQFRAAEALEAGRTPAHWVRAINRRLAVRRLLPGPAATGAQLAGQRVDQLVRFFARGPFFEDEATRAQLLDRLRQTQARWAGLTWDQISAEAAPALSEDK